MSPLGLKESDTTEPLSLSQVSEDVYFSSFFFSLTVLHLLYLHVYLLFLLSS